MIRVLFLISSLNRGGAERQLTHLVKSLDRSRFDVSVVTLYDGGGLQSQIEQLEEVHLFSLHKKGRLDIPAATWRFARLLRQIQPQLVHGYLDVANLLALALGKPSGNKVVWGVRASNVDFAYYGRGSALLFRISCWLSRFADLIIANSHAGMRHYINEGLSGKHMLVIPNGFDTTKFRPDREAGKRVRRTWGIADHECVIGIVARLDPMKDHSTFLRAASQLASQRQHVHFVCVGDGRDSYRQGLRALADDLGLGFRLTWAGELADMPAAQNALDVATSSTAFGEGFSNAVGEAMACGVPCVVTDVGDSAHLVGETGIVVPPGDPDALAAAWSTLLDMPVEQRNALGRSARERITSEFSLDALVRRTEAALEELVRRER